MGLVTQVGTYLPPFQEAGLSGGSAPAPSVPHAPAPLSPLRLLPPWGGLPPPSLDLLRPPDQSAWWQPVRAGPGYPSGASSLGPEASPSLLCGTPAGEGGESSREGEGREQMQRRRPGSGQAWWGRGLSADSRPAWREVAAPVAVAPRSPSEALSSLGRTPSRPPMSLASLSQSLHWAGRVPASPPLRGAGIPRPLASPHLPRTDVQGACPTQAARGLSALRQQNALDT